MYRTVLSKEEIYKMYCNGEPIEKIVSMLMSSFKHFSKTGARNYVKRVIVEQMKSNKNVES